jgi:hypothetical protein
MNASLQDLWNHLGAMDLTIDGIDNAALRGESCQTDIPRLQVRQARQMVADIMQTDGVLNDINRALIREKDDMTDQVCKLQNRVRDLTRALEKVTTCDA